MLQNFSRVPLAPTKWLLAHLLWSLDPEGTVDNTTGNEVMPSWPWMELELVACLLHSFVFLNSYACVVPNMYVGSFTTASSCTFWPPWTPVQEYARMCMYTRIHTEIFFIF